MADFEVKENINLGGNQIKNAGFEVVTSLPTANNNFLGRQVTYQGRSYIWDGSAWVTPNNVYEANLIWGGRNISGGYSPIDAAMVDELGANRLAFAKPDGITIEYSTDGGDTWLDYGASDSTKLSLTSVSTTLVIGKSTYLTASPLDMLRVTFDTSICGIYTVLNKIVLYVSTNGSTGSYVTIQKALQSTPDNYIDHVANIPIAGWVGYNVINIPNLTTYGNRPTSHYGRLRFIFGCTGYNGTSSSHSGLRILSIKGFGGVGWTTPSNMAKRNSLFTYDGFQNAYFPASVQSNETINYDTNNIEPTQSGTVTKTSTWLWQYLTQSVNFLWLKLKDLFPTTQATTHNYLPKIDNANKKLVKSNINDDGNRVQIDSPLRVNSNVYYDVAYLKGSNTGIIKIKTPWTGNSDENNPMSIIEIDIRDHSSEKAAKLTIYFYIYTSTRYSYRTWATLIGDLPSKVIKTCYDPTNKCILIGEATTVWNNTVINISKVTNGFNRTLDDSVGWDISYITDTSSYTGITDIKHINKGLEADLLDGYHAGNTNGAIPINNGTLNTNLFAEKSNKLANSVTITDFTTFNPTTLGLDVGESCNFIASTATGSPMFEGSAICSGEIQRVVSGRYIYIAYSGANTNFYPLQWAIGGYDDGFKGWQLRNAQGLLDLIKTVDGTNSGLDADLLDGSHASDFADVDHDHDATYLGLTATATDSDKLDGKHADAFATVDYVDENYLGINATAADSDKLGGKEGSAFAQLENGKILAGNLPDYIFGQVLYGGSIAINTTTNKLVCTLSANYKSKYNITENTLLLEDILPSTCEGVFFIVTNSWGSPPNDAQVGDWIISNGITWEKVDNTDAVSSVNGQTGAVVLTPANVGAASSNHTHNYESLTDIPENISMGEFVLSEVNLKNITETRIYPLLYGFKYYSVPNKICGTDEMRDDLEGFLFVYKKDGIVSQQLHDTINNILYIRSFDRISEEWNDWKRLLTCRDEIATEPEEPKPFEYIINNTRQHIYIDSNNFDSKNDTIVIDLSAYTSIIGIKFNIGIHFSPDTQSPVNVQIIDNNGKPIQLGSSNVYTDPSTVSNMYWIDYEIWNLSHYWLVGNRIYS